MSALSNVIATLGYRARRLAIAIEALNFEFHFIIINLNLNSYMWLVMTALGATCLGLKPSPAVGLRIGF